MISNGGSLPEGPATLRLMKGYENHNCENIKGEDT